MSAKDQPIDHYIDGHVTTRFEQGEVGAMYLCDSQELRERKRRSPGVFAWPPSTLIGWGHDQRSSALHLVQQLRLYADLIARENGLPIADQTAVDKHDERHRAMRQGVEKLL